MAPNLYQIFTDFNSDGPAESFREVLGYFVKQFWPLVNTQIEKLYFARLDYPLIVFPFYLLAILGFWLFWQKPGVKTAVLAAIPAGALFYIYFHFWVYWIAVLGILFIYSLVNYKKNPILGKNFLILVSIITLIAIPYFINYFQFLGQMEVQDFIYRLGIAEGRVVGLATMGFAYLFYIIVGIAVYFTYFKNDRRRAILFWGMLAAMFVVWNIQLIVGYAPSPNNWRRTISPILFIIIFNLIYDWSQITIKKWPRINFKKYILIGVMILSVLVVTKKIVNVYVIYQNPEPRILNGQTLDQDFMDSFAWINVNLPPESKIASNSYMTSSYLSLYTSARPFLPLGLFSPRSTNELENRFLIAHRLFGTSPEILAKVLDSSLPIKCDQGCPSNTEDNLRKNTWLLYGHFFRDSDFNEFMISPKSITKEYIGSLISRYQKINLDWKVIDAEYVYVGPWERQLGLPNFQYNKNLQIIYENKSVKIYKKQ
ncbi:MAG: hypothetical protein G01um10143_178 [Parcubacteria group bacterium Gr01-1014_3]|nr:MAG: hypothetical protein G01um10143_178 [Parcubacteria group bacterium Gr01-1014_3]